MKVFFEKEFAVVEYNKEHDAILLRWLIPPLSMEFREGLNAVMHAMKFFGTGKLVVDTRKLGTIHPDDQGWSVNDWMPEAMKVGYSHIAIILLSEVSLDAELSQLSVEDTMEEAGSTILTAYFHDLDVAFKWLSEEALVS